MNKIVSEYPITIVGAGITGLALGFLLKQEKIPFVILEKKQRSGGIVLSHEQDGYFFDVGPHSAVLDMATEFFLEQIGVKNEILIPETASDRRFILRDNTLHELKPHPINFIATSLLSAKGKMRLFAEPFIPKKKDNHEESLHDFTERRLGKEAADYLLNPFIAGIYAGNPRQLSLQAVFPKLAEMEQQHGSVIKALKHYKKQNPDAQERKIFSFKKGLHQLTQHLKNILAEHLIEDIEVTSIHKTQNVFQLKTLQQQELKIFQTEKVLFTSPAYHTSEILKDISPNISNILSRVYYPPVLQLSVGYDKKQIDKTAKGFGFLVPEKENKTFLGAIFQSAVFPNRAPKGKASFSLFIGGARNEELFSQYSKEQIIDKTLKEFQQIMKIKGTPETIFSYKWERAIPQYEMGYVNTLNAITEFEQQNKGIYLAGNYVSGVGVADCIKKAIQLSKQLHY
jgi:oxygen-dependent protoporphyrinogen oxidase